MLGHDSHTAIVFSLRRLYRCSFDHSLLVVSVNDKAVLGVVGLVV